MSSTISSLPASANIYMSLDSTGSKSLCVRAVVTMKNKHSKKTSRQVTSMSLYQLISRRYPYLQQLSFPLFLYLYPSSCRGAKVRPQNCITFTVSAGLSFPSQVKGWRKIDEVAFKPTFPFHNTLNSC